MIATVEEYVDGVRVAHYHEVRLNGEAIAVTGFGRSAEVIATTMAERYREAQAQARINERLGFGSTFYGAHDQMGVT